MFGLGGKEKGPKLVGAKEKIMKAQMLKRGRLGDHIESKGEGKKPFGATVALIYILACALAFVLMQHVMKTSGLGVSTGWHAFDRLMFSGGVPDVTGNADQDMILVPLLRGFVIFAVAGILPFLSLLWIRAIDRPNTNPFLAVWGMNIGAFLVFFLFRDFLGPLLGQIMDIASGG
jgi:hypothetical protein